MTSNRTQLIARLSILTAFDSCTYYYTKLPIPQGSSPLLDLGRLFYLLFWAQGRCDCRWCSEPSTDLISGHLMDALTPLHGDKARWLRKSRYLRPANRHVMV